MREMIEKRKKLDAVVPKIQVFEYSFYYNALLSNYIPYPSLSFSLHVHVSIVMYNTFKE